MVDAYGCLQRFLEILVLNFHIALKGFGLTRRVMLDAKILKHNREWQFLNQITVAHAQPQLVAGGLHCVPIPGRYSLPILVHSAA